jgi:hypothetical protein
VDIQTGWEKVVVGNHHENMEKVGINDVQNVAII